MKFWKNIDIGITSSKMVCFYTDYFSLIIGSGQWNLGLVIEKHYVRIMLIWWHVCISTWRYKD